jgi:hypothetical protein
MADEQPQMRLTALMGLLSDPQGLRESFKRQGAWSRWGKKGRLLKGHRGGRGGHQGILGSVDHDKLLTLLNQRAADGRVLGLVKQILDAGCVAAGKRLASAACGRGDGRPSRSAAEYARGI